MWSEVVRLLEDPALIGAEIDRRLEAARASDPNQQCEINLRHHLVRIRKSIDRLVNAYQEDLTPSRSCAPERPSCAVRNRLYIANCNPLFDQAKDRETYLRIAETLTGFLARLRTSATTLDIPERQRIVRLLVKEVLVSEEKITIRHHPDPGIAKRWSGPVEIRQ